MNTPETTAASPNIPASTWLLFAVSGACIIVSYIAWDQHLGVLRSMSAGLAGLVAGQVAFSGEDRPSRWAPVLLTACAVTAPTLILVLGR